jgi:hypothetical protein
MTMDKRNVQAIKPTAKAVKQANGEWNIDVDGVCFASGHNAATAWKIAAFQTRNAVVVGACK